VMQVTAVQVVGMIFMLHFRMPAVIAMLMLVGVVRCVRHGGPPNANRVSTSRYRFSNIMPRKRFGV
jgi:hypothetical protein